MSRKKNNPTTTSESATDGTPAIPAGHRGRGKGKQPAHQNFSNKQIGGDLEGQAILAALDVLKPLQADARSRVIQYVTLRFNIEQQGEQTVRGGEGTTAWPASHGASATA